VTTEAELVLSSLRRLARRADLGLVPLADLRTGFSGMTRAELDAVLLELRRADAVVLSTHDVRHGVASDERLRASIVEQGRIFVYATVRFGR
jgi:hypothetical protein